MKSLFLLASLCLCTVFAYGQSKTYKLTRPIVAEGKMLYKSEMASWYGTDIFLEKYKNRENVGGYLSYPTAAGANCIFFSKGSQPVVIGVIAFDSTYSVEAAKTELTERVFTAQELKLFVIREKALKIIQSDTLFKRYKNTSLNIIPIVYGDKNRVYVLTGPKVDGMVIFGNDYLLEFDSNNNMRSAKRLHKNIISIDYGKKDMKGKEVIVVETMHTHLSETGDFITATDICTLMLYEKIAQWKQHTVVSTKYLSIWNCQKDDLFVLSKEAVDKINKDQKRRYPQE